MYKYINICLVICSIFFIPIKSFANRNNIQIVCPDNDSNCTNFYQHGGRKSFDIVGNGSNLDIRIEYIIGSDWLSIVNSSYGWIELEATENRLMTTRHAELYINDQFVTYITQDEVPYGVLAEISGPEIVCFGNEIFLNVVTDGPVDIYPSVTGDVTYYQTGGYEFKIIPNSDRGGVATFEVEGIHFITGEPLGVLTHEIVLNNYGGEIGGRTQYDALEQGSLYVEQKAGYTYEWSGIPDSWQVIGANSHEVRFTTPNVKTSWC